MGIEEEKASLLTKRKKITLLSTITNTPTINIPVFGIKTNINKKILKIHRTFSLILKECGISYYNFILSVQRNNKIIKNKVLDKLTDELKISFLSDKIYTIFINELCYNSYTFISNIMDNCNVFTAENLVYSYSNGKSGIYWLCYRNINNLEKFLKIIDYKFIIKKTIDNKSPFFWLCASNYTFLKQYVNDNEIPISEFLIESSEESTPLLNCCYNNIIEVIRPIIQFLIQENKLTDIICKKNIHNKSCLSWLCYNGSKLLINIFNNINNVKSLLLEVFDDGKTLFYWLCYSNYSDLRHIIIKYEITINDLFISVPKPPFYWICRRLNTNALLYIFQNFKITKDKLFEIAPNKLFPLYYLIRDNYIGLDIIFKMYNITPNDMKLLNIPNTQRRCGEWMYLNNYIKNFQNV